MEKLSIQFWWRRQILTSLFSVIGLLQAAGCGYHSIVTPGSTGSDVAESGVILKVVGDPTTIDVTEGSTIALIFSQSAVRKKATILSVTVEGSSSEITDVFGAGVPVPMTIAAGSSTGSVSIPTIHNTLYTGPRTFTLKITTDDSNVTVSGATITLRIVDLESAPVISMAAASQNISEGAGSGTVTVSMTPGSASAVQVAYTFTTGTASGSDFTGTNGSLTFSPGQTSKTIPFTLAGDTTPESTESFTVDLGSVTGDASVSGTSNSHTVNIIDDDQVNISITNVTANEGGNLVFDVTLNLASSLSITVDWATANGTASAGTHYTAASGTLTFTPGQTSKQVTIATAANLAEVCAAARTMTVGLSNPTNAVIAVTSGTGTITDPDRPSISIAAASAAEASTLSFTVSLSQACASSNVTFDWATSAGTATAATDYATSSGTATSITAGNTSTTVSVPTVSDTTVEASETLTVTLSNLTNATSGTLTATGTITDDDHPNVTIADLSVAENAGTASVTVTLSQAAPYNVAVDWATTNGTALSGTHYTAGSGTLTITAGQTSGTISVSLTNNAACAADTNFTVGISNPTNGAVITDSSATVTIQNEDFPSLTATGVTVTEGYMASIPLTLSTTCGAAVTVNYTLSDVTTTAGSDYYNSATSITIPAGQTSYYLPISTTQDFNVESAETFTVNFNSATNATVGTSQVTVTVNDDDVNVSSNSNVTQVETGASSTCAVVNGAAYCWGSNYNGEVGDLGTYPKVNPTAVSGLSTGVTEIGVSKGSISSLSGSANFACALKSGAVYCWGSDSNGALGNGAGTTHSGTPTVIASLNASVTDLSVGVQHSCAIKSSTLYCWGDNAAGQIGNGNTTDQQAPVAITLGGTPVSVSAGQFHTCAVLSDNRIQCWGRGSFGRLGNNDTADSLSPVYVSGIDGTTNAASAVAAGINQTCAIVNGAAQCWGNNSGGQLGDGTTNQSSVPVSVSGATSGVTHISVGGTTNGNSRQFGCAAVSGALKCWGNGTSTPSTVTGLSSNVTSSTLNEYVTCAVQSGVLKCWGESFTGQVGNGLSYFQFLPTDVSGLPYSISALAVGHHTGCAINSTGALYCWGMNSSSQMGLGNSNKQASAVQVISSNVSKVSVSGDSYSSASNICAVLTDGTVKCAGDNGSGQLGDSTVTGRSTFVTATILGSTNVVDIAASKQYTCVIVSGGTVKCWGRNNKGQLGNNSNSNSPSTPVDVTGITSATRIVATTDHICAIDGGALKCWGDNTAGQLGVSDNTVRWVPTPVTGMGSGVTWVDVTGGSGTDGHTCAVKDGAAYCWGNGANNRLGNGSTSNQNAPVGVTGLTSGISRVAVRVNSSCALNGSGGVECWGYNTWGDLGVNSGTTSSYAAPQAVVGLASGLLDIEGGTYLACARTAVLGVKCWGYNEGGAAGGGSQSYVTSPTSILFP